MFKKIMSAARKINDGVFSTILLITTLAVIVPFSPLMPWDTLDPSWTFGMNQAAAQALTFGQDIVFTFGPYASVSTRTFHPAIDELMMWSSFYLGLSFFLAVYLNFRQCYRYLRLGLVVALASLMLSLDALLFFYPLLVGTYLFRSTVLEINQPSNKNQWHAILVLLYAPFGLLPLIKGSFLILCLAITTLSIIILIKEGAWKSVILVCVTPILSILLFWAIAGQPIHAVTTYILTMLPLIGGYGEAMAKQGAVSEVIFYTTGTLVVVWCVLFNSRTPIIGNITAALMFLCVLFLAFKAGFVRHDGHAVIAGSTILIVSLLAGTITSEKKAAISVAVAFSIWFYIDAIYGKTSTQMVIASGKSTYVTAWQGLKARLSKPEKLLTDFNARLTVLQARNKLPTLDGTTDIYSVGQSALIASENKWNPRPTFQSYAAYTSVLAERNKYHLLGAHPPDNIIFKVQPIDGRIPSLEDGTSWPVLLSAYEPTSISDGYLFLKRRTLADNASHELISISSNNYSFNEHIILPSDRKSVFAKINIKQNLMGIVWGLLYKPTELELTFWLDNGRNRSYRLIANMAESGFLVSPLIEKTEEFGMLYAGEDYLENKRVRSITISPKSGSNLWHPNFEIEFFSTNNNANKDYIKIFNFVRPHNDTQLPAITYGVTCEGHIDFINNISPAPRSFKSRPILNIHGWAATSTAKGEIPDSVYIVLTEKNGNRFFIKTNPTQRPDVATHFNKLELSAAGYTATADVSQLKGDYSLSLAYLKNDTLSLCPQFNISALSQ